MHSPDGGGVTAEGLSDPVERVEHGLPSIVILIPSRPRPHEESEQAYDEEECGWFAPVHDLTFGQFPALDGSPSHARNLLNTSVPRRENGHYESVS